MKTRLFAVIMSSLLVFAALIVWGIRHQDYERTYYRGYDAGYIYGHETVHQRFKDMAANPKILGYGCDECTYMRFIIRPTEDAGKWPAPKEN